MNSSEYKQIAQHEKYYVNRSGHVYRRQSNGGFKVLKGQPNSKGYLRMKIRLNGKEKWLFIHRLVNEAFNVNPKPSEYNQCNHIDGNKHNNRADNLEYVSQSMNIRHAFRTGLMKSNNVKLTEKNVKEILIYKGIMPRIELAEMFGVSVTAIAHIYNNKTWKHIPRC